MRTTHWILLAIPLTLGCGESDAPKDVADADTDTDTGPDTPVEPCEWPTGTAGIEIGERLPSSLAWDGFGPADTEPRSVSIEEFYDCDGRLGDLHGLLITSAARWCSWCELDASEISAAQADWAAEGLNIKVIHLVVQDDDYSSATVETARAWRDDFELSDVYVMADPGMSMFAMDLPSSLAVNPRTMEVVDVTAGYDPSHEGLLTMARAIHAGD